MKKYIQKEELEQGVNDLLLKCLDNDNLSQQYSMGYIGAITNVIGLIERLTKMAAKVKSEKQMYGHWISNEFGRIFICSECSEMRGQKEKYCPNCGTNMKGVAE